MPSFEAVQRPHLAPSAQSRETNQKADLMQSFGFAGTFAAYPEQISGSDPPVASAGEVGVAAMPAAVLPTATAAINCIFGLRGGGTDASDATATAP